MPHYHHYFICVNRYYIAWGAVQGNDNQQLRLTMCFEHIWCRVQNKRPISKASSFSPPLLEPENRGLTIFNLPLDQIQEPQ